MSRLKKKLIKLKKGLDKKVLRAPRTNPQLRDRLNWERVRIILNKRYDHLT